MRNSISGELYSLVVVIILCSRFGLPNIFAELKSISFITPLLSMTIFVGFKSLCIIQFWCRYESPSNIYFIMHFTCSGLSIMFSLSLKSKSPKSIAPYSRTQQRRPLRQKTSSNLITFGWFNSYKSLISRSNENSRPFKPIMFFYFFIATSLGCSFFSAFSNISFCGNNYSFYRN